MNNFIWSIRVYYEDTDAAGVVYYANYLKFMERSRTEWLRQLGVDQIQLKQHYNLVFVVRQMTIDYLRPALLDDLLKIVTYMTHLGKASITMNQKILRQTEVLCIATIKIACVNIVNLRPQPIPPEILKEFLKITN